jgi:hypothetical protein
MSWLPTVAHSLGTERGTSGAHWLWNNDLFSVFNEVLGPCMNTESTEVSLC